MLNSIIPYCSVKAAGERHADGNFAESLRINRERFGMSPQLAEIFENTMKELGW